MLSIFMFDQCVVFCLRSATQDSHVLFPFLFFFYFCFVCALQLKILHVLFSCLFLFLFYHHIKFKFNFSQLGLGDESWNDLLQNPAKWWDNRLDKVTTFSAVIGFLIPTSLIHAILDSFYWCISSFWSHQKNPKGPDFKHKDTGEGLWLRGSPSWVLPKLPPLKPKQQSAETSWNQISA